MSKMELHVWEGEPAWGLPSMDLESLQMMLYIKFCGAPVDIIKSVSPSRAPSGCLPAFTCSEGTFTNFSSMTAFLRKQNYSSDHDLSARQCSDVMAYEHLLQEKLLPALIYFWWVEPKSYHAVIHSWFYSHMQYPFKIWVPSNKHKAATELIEVLVDEPDDPIAVETQLLRQAQECLTMISNRLGEREYFFGRSPSAIDALLVAYLAMLLKVDLKMPALQNHVKACPNLSRYVFKCLQRFFPNESGGGSSKSTSGGGAGSSSSRTRGGDDSGAPASGQAEEDDEFPNKKRNIVLCALVALAANLTYAIATGIVQVDMGDKSMIDDDEDYYDIDD